MLPAEGMLPLEVEVTRYQPGPEGRVLEATTTEKTLCYFWEADDGTVWLRIKNSPASMPWDRVDEAINDKGGWSAQAGTPPVYSPPCPHPQDSHFCCGRTCELPRGGWGGRNYPKEWVSAEELQKLKNLVEILSV